MIPNAIDFTIWDKLKNNTHKTYINIGWEGGSSHTKDLAIIEDISYSLYDWFKETIMPEDQSYLQQVFWITLFFRNLTNQAIFRS